MNKKTRDMMFYVSLAGCIICLYIARAFESQPLRPGMSVNHLRLLMADVFFFTVVGIALLVFSCVLLGFSVIAAHRKRHPRTKLDVPDIPPGEVWPPAPRG